MVYLCYEHENEALPRQCSLPRFVTLRNSLHLKVWGVWHPREKQLLTSQNFFLWILHFVVKWNDCHLEESLFHSNNTTKLQGLQHVSPGECAAAIRYLPDSCPLGSCCRCHHSSAMRIDDKANRECGLETTSWHCLWRTRLLPGWVVAGWKSNGKCVLTRHFKTSKCRFFFPER